MTDLPAILRRMAEMGLTMEQAAEIAELFRPVRTRQAERQARYRARKAAGPAGDVTRDATGDVTALPPSPSPTPLTLTTNPVPPSPPKGGSSPTGDARPKRVRGSSRVPQDWSPSPEDLAFAATEGLSPGEIERELARMRDCHFRFGRSDWDAVFRNWIRKAKDLKPANDRPDPNHNRLTTRQANFERALAGFDAVAGRLERR